MKKFYYIFFSLPVLVFTLVWLPIGWSIGALGTLMLFIVYQLYNVRLQAAQDRIDVLEYEAKELNVHLEKSVVKEQKTGKEAEAVRQAKQQLLSVLSHEIRTPMNGVLGMSLLLSESPLSIQQAEYVHTIRSCSEGLLTTVNNLLVNDILDFSKLQLEGKQLEYKNFDLRDAIEEVMDMFAEKTGKAGVVLVTDIGMDVPEQLIGDSKRLRQVLMNLMENAVNFTKGGEIVLRVQYTSTKNGHSPELGFELRDTGCGISKEQLKHLFMGIPTAALKKESAATGLGLIICKKLVELMGGTIEVKTEPGKGSSFSFSLPLTPSLNPKRPHARFNSMHLLEGKQVLVLHTNETFRSILIQQLENWKMLPVSTGSASEAMELLSGQNKFDLVLADIPMQGKDGVQPATSIRLHAPSIPIIGLNQAADYHFNQEAGIFSSVIIKTLRQHILRDRILDNFTPAIIDNENKSALLFAEQYPLRILIAEDNLINQKIAVKILNRLGYKPAVACDGREALEMVSTDPYDLILMDVQMPGMNGLEATKMIRTCLELQPVIIALTANAMQGDRDDCLQAGMDDYMSKPIELKELLSQLEKWALAIHDKERA